MTNEFRRRPFSRPLLFWITGICLYVFTPYEWIVPGLLCLALSAFAFPAKVQEPEYRDRWQWGMMFSILLVALAVLVSAYSDRQEGGNSFLSSLAGSAAVLREKLLSGLYRLNLDQTERDVLGTMLLGDMKTIDRDIRMQFSVTGVAHILSVSGFHVAVVCGFYSLLMKMIPSSRFFDLLKYLSTMLLLWGFTVITGLAPPSVRAALMLSFFLTGRFIRRTTDGYNTLAASAFFMLIYNPFYLFDIGFQLSYIAVYSILLLMPPLNSLLVIRNPLISAPYGWLAISVAAQAGTAFLCLYYFGQFPVLFLFTNLPFSLVSTLLIPAGLTYLLLPADLPGCAFLGMSVDYMTRFLLYITGSFSLFPWVSFIIPFDFPDLIISYISLIFLVVFVYRRQALFLIASCSFFVILLIKLLIGDLWLSTT